MQDLTDATRRMPGSRREFAFARLRCSGHRAMATSAALPDGATDSNKSERLFMKARFSQADARPHSPVEEIVGYR